MKKKSFKQQDVHFDNFSDLINAASVTYTLSLKAACKKLKCSRSWATKYIRPNVPSIYIPNGKGTGKPNYARMVSLAIKKEPDMSNNRYSNESIYLDKKAFNEYVLSCITSCKKRSKSVFRTMFIKPDCLEEYYRELLKIALDRKNNFSIGNLYLKYAKNEYVKKIIGPAEVYATNRTKAEFIDVPLPDVPIQDWKAVHDIMDYGDVEETIYREMFKEGYIRVELKFPDQDGVIKNTGKVYYIPDPVRFKKVIPDGEMSKRILSSYGKKDNAEKILDDLICYVDNMNIKQSAWIEYNVMLGNKITY